MATPTSPQALSDARWTVMADLNRGESVEQTASYLMNSGWEESDALKHVEWIRGSLDGATTPRPWDAELPTPALVEVEPRAKEVHRVSRRGTMHIGAAWLLGGLIITMTTYEAASVGGGTYVVMSGAMVYGAVRFLVGFSAYRKAGRRA